VTVLADSVLENCTSLATVNIRGPVNVVGNRAFYACVALAGISLPNTVTSIGDYAFAGCTGLTSVAIPESVTTIGDYTFANCTGLTSVTIPAGVTRIGAHVFDGCTALTAITVDAANTAYSSRDGILYDKAQTTILTAPRGIVGTVTVVGTVNTISESAFQGCIHLTDVTIPDSVTSIGSFAFANCTGLTSMTIPAGVTSIGAYAFYGCTGLSSITFLGSPPEIGGNLADSAVTATVVYPEALATTTWANYVGAKFGGLLTQIDGFSVTSPSAPFGLLGSPTGTDRVLLSWNAPETDGGSPITDYSIQYSSDNGVTWTTFIHTASVLPEVTVTGLTWGTTYVFRAAAVNAVGTSSYSGQSDPVMTNVPNWDPTPPLGPPLGMPPL